MAISVVLAEDSYLVREGVTRLLEQSDDIELVASADDYESLLSAVEQHGPDIVLTDIRMPPTNTDEGIRAAEHLRDAHPGMGVVVLSQYDDPEYTLALLRGGAQRRAYLLKDRLEGDQLMAAIREVARGGSHIDPKVVEALVASKSRAAQSPLARLTPRELEVLGEMAQGKNNAAIAATFTFTERAVEKHINSIFSKLGLSEEPDVHRRVKAVLVFLADQS
jgi:DNA-binding NarL/FixJ family response regulator